MIGEAGWPATAGPQNDTLMMYPQWELARESNTVWHRVLPWHIRSQICLYRKSGSCSYRKI